MITKVINDPVKNQQYSEPPATWDACKNSVKPNTSFRVD